MELSIISFTEQGLRLSEKLAGELMDLVSEEDIRTKWSGMKNSPQYEQQHISQWAKVQMEQKHALLFIGACGIAVRAIAPWVTDKLHDSPVLVMDEQGQYVIPILSGHMGGANELAWLLAGKTGAVPVITTATDLNKKFAVDMFAKKNGLAVVNKDGIAKVSAKVLAGEDVTISVEHGHCSQEGPLPQGLKLVPYPPESEVDIMVTSEKREIPAAILLRPREYVIGVGCRRGKEEEKLEAFIRRILQEQGIEENQVLALASVDRKKDEPGLLAWSRKANVPFFTYSPEQLNAVEGEFSPSEFVKAQVGVDNVCERAALCGCGPAKLIVRKHAEDGMTIAVAKRTWRVSWNEA